MLAVDFCIRPARPGEQATLESLQRRASLNNPGDREALLANPDAIAVPIEQIAQGCVFVAERDGVVVGFAAVCHDQTAMRSWMRCSWNRTSGSMASDGNSSTTLPTSLVYEVPAFCTSLEVPTRAASILLAAFE